MNPHVHQDLQAIQSALSNYDTSFLSSDEEDYCPLCIEPMDITDKNFFPCPCGYQICQFCYNNIRQNPELNGRCPACRRKYDDDSVRYVTLSTEELKMERAKLARRERERKQREKEKKDYEYNSRKHLAGTRVIQKNLVYVVGVNPPVPYEEVGAMLRSEKYFGQYGKINKIVVNKKSSHNGVEHHHHSHHSPGYGVYVTFANKEDAAKCIAQVDGTLMDGKIIKAAYGTTKYCSSYLRGVPCPNPNCMFLHEPGEEADSFNKKELAKPMSSAQAALQQHSTLHGTTTTVAPQPVAGSNKAPLVTPAIGSDSVIQSPALARAQLHNNDHFSGVSTGTSTPVLTPAPVPVGSNPWGISQVSTPTLHLSKNSSNITLPTLKDKLNDTTTNSSSFNNPQNLSSYSGTSNSTKDKKKNSNAHSQKETLNPYDALGTAVRGLDRSIRELSEYKNRPLRLRSKIIDDETYNKYPAWFSWDTVPVDDTSDGTLTRKLVATLSIKPVDYSASVMEFVQSVNKTAPSGILPETLQTENEPPHQLNSNLTVPAAVPGPIPPYLQQVQQGQQGPMGAIHTPPPPGMFPPSSQNSAMNPQPDQTNQNSIDLLNQLINGRGVAAGN